MSLLEAHGGSGGERKGRKGGGEETQARGAEAAQASMERGLHLRGVPSTVYQPQFSQEALSEVQAGLCKMERSGARGQPEDGPTDRFRFNCNSASGTKEARASALPGARVLQMCEEISYCKEAN